MPQKIKPKKEKLKTMKKIKSKIIIAMLIMALMLAFIPVLGGCSGRNHTTSRFTISSNVQTANEFFIRQDNQRSRIAPARAITALNSFNDDLEQDAIRRLFRDRYLSDEYNSPIIIYIDDQPINYTHTFAGGFRAGAWLFLKYINLDCESVLLEDGSLRNAGEIENISELHIDVDDTSVERIDYFVVHTTTGAIVDFYELGLFIPASDNSVAILDFNFAAVSVSDCGYEIWFREGFRLAKEYVSWQSYFGISVNENGNIVFERVSFAQICITIIEELDSWDMLFNPPEFEEIGFNIFSTPPSITGDLNILFDFMWNAENENDILILWDISNPHQFIRQEFAFDGRFITEEVWDYYQCWREITPNSLYQHNVAPEDRVGRLCWTRMHSMMLSENQIIFAQRLPTGEGILSTIKLDSEYGIATLYQTENLPLFYSFVDRTASGYFLIQTQPTIKWWEQNGVMISVGNFDSNMVLGIPMLDGSIYYRPFSLGDVLGQSLNDYLYLPVFFFDEDFDFMDLLEIIIAGNSLWQITPLPIWQLYPFLRLSETVYGNLYMTIYLGWIGAVYANGEFSHLGTAMFVNFGIFEIKVEIHDDLSFERTDLVGKIQRLA